MMNVEAGSTPISIIVDSIIIISSIIAPTLYSDNSNDNDDKRYAKQPLTLSKIERPEHNIG